MLFVHDVAAQTIEWNEDYSTQWNAQWARLEAEDTAARDTGTLLGRVLRHRFADGFAVYQVTKVNSRTVRAEHVPIGDGWILPAWGRTPTLRHAQVEQFGIARRGLFG